MTDLTTISGVNSSFSADIAPALSVAAIADPSIAAALQLAPVAIQLLQTAQQLSQAGVMSPAQLAALFAQIGSGIQATHTAWEQANGKTNTGGTVR